MANRPATLCELKKGKLIDTQQGFVDTFNFAVRAIDNLKGGKNCEVDWTIPDHPVINVDVPETESGGGGNVQFSGTSGTTNQGTSFTFSKQSNSNVTITCSGTDIKIGVYYI